ncbi:MAG: stress response protein, partial [Actinomycetota bacterium]|nr:stress response protein [Actinomycetota bacterium]
KVDLHHYSWSQILAEAVMQKEHRGVADPDQAWVLGELIRYLEHPRSGALEFDDMGASWVPVRDAVAAGNLRTSDKGAAEVLPASMRCFGTSRCNWTERWAPKSSLSSAVRSRRSRRFVEPRWSTASLGKAGSPGECASPTLPRR